MVAFRKWFPALAILALVLGSASMASAQQAPAFTCNTNAGVPPLVRAEGITEMVGDVILNCTGGIPTVAAGIVPQVNFQIFLNTNVTSRLVADPWSEALLMIDEPQPAEQLLCTGSPCAVTGTGALTGVNYKAAGVPNVFQGRNAGANSIVWLGVPVDPPGTTSTRVIRITNVRANANQLGVSSTLIPTQIVMFISATGTTQTAINNPQQLVAYVTPGLTFSLRKADNSDSLSSSGVSYLQCVSFNKDSSTDTSKALSSGNSFVARFREGFAASFKIRNYTTLVGGEAPGNQNVPGTLYNNETGFFRDSWSVTTGSTSGNTGSGDGRIGLASHGTRLMLRLTNIPAGVSAFVSIYNNGLSSGTGAKARLVSTDANGGGAFSAVSSTNSLSAGTYSGALMAPVTISGGAGAAVWEVISADPLSQENFDFVVAIAYTANTSSNLPGLGTASASGSFAPLSTVTTQSSSAPIPRFADTATARTAFVINACTTNLLFPFVTNQAGFDTGLAISNTSQDPFGTGLQSGTCKINYYGGTTGGGAAPSAQTSGVVPAGGQLLWVLSSGGNLGVTATPGFQGYIIAQCAFQYAHGFAFITDGPVGQARIAEGYLALILDGALSSRTVFLSEVLGH